MLPSLAKLFFERAEECALDVHVSSGLVRRAPPTTEQVALTLPPGKRIRTLSIKQSWVTIQEIISVWADALSPLQALELNADESSLSSSRSTIFVGDALMSLTLMGYAVPGLVYIRAPNLTAFRLYETSQTPCSATRLLDFLEAAPALEEVLIFTDSTIVGDFPPPERTVTLSYVQRILFSIRHGPQLALYLNCPSLKDTQLVNMFSDDPAVGVFPPSLQLLLGRYSIETIDWVTMVVSDQEGHKNCSLQLRTPSGTTFLTACETAYVPEPFPSYSDEDDEWTFSVLFDHAVSTLLSLSLGRVTGFSIDIGYPPLDPTVDSTDIITKLAGVLEKCTNLHEVVLGNYLPSCFPVFSLDKIPSIQVLVIKHPQDVLWEELAERVAEVARIRHSRGAPLHKIEIFMTEERPRIEGLEGWVQEVKYQAEPSRDNRRTSWS